MGGHERVYDVDCGWPPGRFTYLASGFYTGLSYLVFISMHPTKFRLGAFSPNGRPVSRAAFFCAMFMEV